MESTTAPLSVAEELVLVALEHFKRQDPGTPQPAGRLSSWLNTRATSTITWTSMKVGSALRGLRKMGLVIAIDSRTMEPLATRTVEPGYRALWKLADIPEQTALSNAARLRDVQVYLTADQCLYLAGISGKAQGHILDAEDVVIFTVDDTGGIFVANASDLAEDGAGVWVDAAGNEHYTPGADFKELDIDWRQKMAELHQGRPTLESVNLEVDPLGEMEKLQKEGGD